MESSIQKINENEMDSLQNDKQIEEEEKITFETLNLKEELLRGIYAYGYEKPSLIQANSIPHINAKRDIVAQSHSGTGKTASFGIGVLQTIDTTSNYVQAIIVAPTRELADQSNDVISSLGSFMSVKTCVSIGGSSVHENRYRLKNAHVVIGTPGRLVDLIERSILSTSHVKILVMDEADQLLQQDFLEKIKYIVNSIPEDSQICLFSATMPKELMYVTTKFLNDPVNIFVKQEELTLDGIKQYIVDVGKEQYKLETLMDLYKSLRISQSIIFVNTIAKAEYVKKNLKDNNFTVAMFHGQLTPQERREVMKKFKSGDCRVLISSDVLSRGIDVQHVNIVINYDLSNDKESYIHRIGRSGRYGRKGLAINFVTDKTMYIIDELRDHYKTVIDYLPSEIEDII
jgi:superfamily II DNA/RNA helicase